MENGDAVDIWTACRNGKIDIVRELLDSEPLLASIGDPNNSQVTPLHWASINNHRNIVELLLIQYKVDPNIIG